MKEPVWVLPEIVLAVHQMLLAEHGGAGGIRDQALLESALNRPMRHYEYADDPSIFDLAASYCHGLASNHPFIDGNKRVSLTVAALFLEINGWTLDAPEPEAAIVIEDLAAGRINEVRLSRWFRHHARPQET